MAVCSSDQWATGECSGNLFAKSHYLSEDRQVNKSIKKYQTLFHSFIIKQESILRWFSGNWMESKCLCSLCSLVKRGSQMGMSCSYSPRSTRRPLLPKCPEREQPRRRERTGGKHTANSLLGIVCLRLSLSLMFQKTAWESQEHVTHFRNALSLSSVNVIHILRSELSLNAFILEKKADTDTLTHDAHAGDEGSNPPLSHTNISS